MKISELKDIDIKNINAKQINEFVLKKPNITISILMVLVSFFFVFKFFSETQTNSQEIKRKIDEVQKKIDVINQYNQKLKEFNEYVDDLPQGLAGSGLIDTLTEIAEKDNIRVLSFSNSRFQSRQFYDLTSINLDISAKTYKDLLLFVYEIENSSHNLRVNQWAESRSEDSNDLDQSRHNVTLSIDSISFKKI